MKVEKVKEYKYAVESSTKTYDVIKRKDGSWFCSCPAFMWQSGICKHIQAVKEYLEPRWEIQNDLGNWVKANEVPRNYLHWLILGTTEYFSYWIAWDDLESLNVYRKGMI